MMKPTVKQFAKFVLEQEGLFDWTLGEWGDGAEGKMARKEKKILLGKKATYGLVLHEIAHALDKNPPTVDGHWGYHADLMHQLFDKYGTIPDFQNEINVD